MPRTISRLGWKPQLGDRRDRQFAVSGAVLQTLPPSYDLTTEKPLINFPIYDQGQIGSCTANALAAAVQFDRLQSGQAPDFVPSRLFLYYNERQMEGTVASDSGASLRDGVSSLVKKGICPEADWPYDPTPPATEGGLFPVGSAPATHPPQPAYDDAASYAISSYQAVPQSLSQLQAALFSGYPFVFGFSVYASWYDTQAATIPMPSGDDSLVGGHAVLAVAYDNATQMFKFRNSWGANVGVGGYFYIPYSYITDPDLADDFWVINAVKG